MELYASMSNCKMRLAQTHIMFSYFTILLGALKIFVDSLASMIIWGTKQR